jgi:hypothetical protein
MILHAELEAPSPSRPPALFQVGAVASVAGLRDTCGNVPLDACVPTLTGADLPHAMSDNTRLVLRHIDGTASLGSIAEAAGMSFSDAIESFLILLRLGVIAVREDSIAA